MGGAEGFFHERKRDGRREGERGNMNMFSLKRESYLFQNTLPWNSLSSPRFCLLVTLQMDQTILFSINSIHPFMHLFKHKDVLDHTLCQSCDDNCFRENLNPRSSLGNKQ